MVKYVVDYADYIKKHGSGSIDMNSEVRTFAEVYCAQAGCSDVQTGTEVELTFEDSGRHLDHFVESIPNFEKHSVHVRKVD